MVSVKRHLGVEGLESSEAEVVDIQEQVRAAEPRLARANSFVDRDPVYAVLTRVPVLNEQLRSLGALVRAGHDSAKTGLVAATVLLDYSQQKDDPERNSVQEAIAFIVDQEEAMGQVAEGLGRLQRERDRVSQGGLLGPLSSARTQLDDAIEKLDALVAGYQRANAFLPGLLGYDGTRTYLVLPQNDTELFPSGGLISSYGLATFSWGKLEKMEFEYFVDLFDRWQRTSNHEYVEPPSPLKNYLLRHVSWGLGEAGWYPDFPTTADLARTFTEKGGVPPTGGTIALDIQFVEGLLALLGPLPVSEYGVTVTAENVNEVTLAETRNESALPGAAGKAFLSALGKGMLERVFAVPRDKWVDLLKLLDRMGRERHLQLNFTDQRLQALSKEYGFDGGMVTTDGDFLLLADASVQSTKLNLILRPTLEVDVTLDDRGGAEVRLSYQVTNPFPEWRQGRDPLLVKLLMLDGVYGSYLRAYVPRQAKLTDLRLDGQTVGAEQIDLELGRRVFGRFFPLLPGETKQVEFFYKTASVFERLGDRANYRLYVQKEAGTRAIPLQVRVTPPDGAAIAGLSLDGQQLGELDVVSTDLRTDRVIEAELRWP